MFTGIVTDIGTVGRVERNGDTRFEIATAYALAAVPIGASIACGGACLTVVAKGADWFAATASGETLARTTLGGWRRGTRVNLERALALGAELGGHLVTGHVDAVAHLVERTPEGGSWRLVIAVPAPLARYIAAKGSVTLDGVSLTVNEVAGERFTVNLIPHTLAVTTFAERRQGDALNLEIDLIARYLARLTGKD
ncbi:MAG: riboflavin synthase [Alphaproteobacteria bacterium]|nr:riboflavin synthase [Alphaproteobacteria bacterium]